MMNDTRQLIKAFEDGVLRNLQSADDAIANQEAGPLRASTAVIALGLERMASSVDRRAGRVQPRPEIL